MIFNQVVEVEKLLIGDHDLLLKVESIESKIITLEKGLTEDSNDYGVIISVGDSVDKTKYAIGNIILGVRGGTKAFEHKKVKYMIASIHNIGIMTTPDNFKLTKNASKSVQKSK